MASTYSAVAANRAAALRAAGDRDVVAGGLPSNHPAVVLALEFIAGMASAATHRNYGASLGRWFRWCVAHPVNPFDVTRLHSKAYLASLGGTLRVGTQAAYLAGVRSFYEEAWAEGMVTHNPFRRVKPKGIRRSMRRTPWLREEQLAFALQVAARKVPTCRGLSALRDYVLVYVGCRLGLRRAEYSALVLASFRESSGRYVVDIEGKGDSDGEVVVPDDVRELLDYWYERLARAIGRRLGPDDAVFPKLGLSDGVLRYLDHSKPLPALEPPGVATAVKRVLADGGLIGPRYASHVLRATAATLAFRSGANRFDVMVLLRHADATMTDRYIDGANDASAAETWRPDAPFTPAEMRKVFLPKRRRPRRQADEAA